QLQPAENHQESEPVPERRSGLQAALPGLEKHREKMDDADQGMEASAATIRDCVRRQNAVTLKHQQVIYTEKLRPSIRGHSDFDNQPERLSTTNSRRLEPYSQTSGRFHI